MKKKLTEWERIFASYPRYIRIYGEMGNLRKKHDSFEKWAMDLNIEFLEGDLKMTKKYLPKMLIIPSN